MEKGTHRLKVVGYSTLVSQTTPGVSFASAPFHVGGHDWAIRFFPAVKDATDVGRVAIVLELVSDVPPFLVRAWYSLDVEEDPFDPDDEPANPVLIGPGLVKRWGFRPESTSIQPAEDDSITVRCTVEVREFESGNNAALPPPNMPEHHLKFLATDPKHDIVFEVGDAEFPAHFRVFRERSAVLQRGAFRATVRRRRQDVLHGRRRGPRRVLGRAPVRLHRRGAGGPVPR
ncbi:hypothetical protein QOZ80_5AG0389700 [Eleusine coracana subsp. coracana]|nr:hypothetical protein QOZ80_5AG0389700 [Eleusine coracana subsp. coracana]